MYDEIDHKLLLSTIPHPGSASTVRGLRAGTEAQYNIWVKSGSMERDSNIQWIHQKQER